MLRFLPILLVTAVVATQKGLVDHPIASSGIEYLDGHHWTATSDSKLSIRASVPGDLLSDLFNANIIGDPLHELNFQNSSIWDDHVWTYSRHFSLNDELLAALIHDNHTDLLLSFDGIKMAADIHLNGELIGQAVDQFLRYTFSLKTAKLLSGKDANELTVTFDPKVDVNGRFMACTGGWDWAPYSITNEGHNASLARTFTKGIWKSVYLSVVTKAAITHVVPHTFYTGDFPNTPLIPHHHADFRLTVRIHTYAPVALNASFHISGIPGHFLVKTPVEQVNAGDASVLVTVDVKAKDIELWWPAGISGGRKMYDLRVVMKPHSAIEDHEEVIAEASRRIAFRSVALVTGNDTDASYVEKNKNADGTDSQGMFLRINGMPLYSRGANMIPMDQLEGRLNANAHQILVKSAVDAGMNTLRVWGGGMFLPDSFYDICDELGVLLYHDMQFAQEGHSPTKCQVQDEEFRHQIRRLSHHPSIIIWDGCNECQVVLDTPTGIYASFVMTVVAEEDKSRIIWPSCPADGWVAGVNRLTSLPNSSPLGLKPRALPSDKKIETHGPYQHGAGFPAVNGDEALEDFPSNLPITIKETLTGVSYPNIYASEFGCSVMSSFESMAPTLEEKHWGLHGGEPADTCSPSGFDKTCKGPNAMAQRNYPCDNILDVYFGLDATINQTGEAVFKKQLFQCMVGQALVMKSDIETRRSTNEFGTVIWQLGENWPTGGWGSLEYGADAEGQVLGGRWKPLHYWLKSSLFTDVTAACGAGGVCYLKNDLAMKRTVELQVAQVDLNGNSTIVLKEKVHLPAGPGYTKWFNIPTFDATENVIHTIVSDADEVLCSNVQLFEAPKKLKLRKANLSFKISPHINHDGSIDIHIHSDNVALFVTLTTKAQGRFSDNTILVVPPSATVKFIPFLEGGVTPKELAASLRIEDVSNYANL